MKNLLLTTLCIAGLSACTSFAPSPPETIQSVTFWSWDGGSSDHAIIIRRDLSAETSKAGISENDRHMQKTGTVTQAQFDTLVKELEAANYIQRRHVFTLMVASQGTGGSDILIETDKRIYSFHSNHTTHTFPPEIDKIHAKWIKNFTQK